MPCACRDRVRVVTGFFCCEVHRDLLGDEEDDNQDDDWFNQDVCFAAGLGLALLATHCTWMDASHSTGSAATVGRADVSSYGRR